MGCGEECVVGHGPPMPCCLGEIAILLSIRRTLWSISSATRGKWPSPTLTLPIIINELSLRAANLFICKIGLYGATGKEDSLKNKSQRGFYRGRERGLTSIPNQNRSSPQVRIRLTTGGSRRPLALNSSPGNLSDPPPHPKVVLSARENLPFH